MNNQVKQLIEYAIEEFNRFHGVEATVKIVGWRENKLIAEFRDSFCLSCGFYDYFDDFSQLLESRGVKAMILNITEQSDDVIVEYILKTAGEGKRFMDKVISIFE